jgi:hypothetical protein
VSPEQDVLVTTRLQVVQPGRDIQLAVVNNLEATAEASWSLHEDVVMASRVDAQDGDASREHVLADAVVEERRVEVAVGAVDAQRRVDGQGARLAMTQGAFEAYAVRRCA